jgi:hypothetical protein
MSIKCLSCGLVNWSTANACRRCNTLIQAQANTTPPALLQVQRSIPPAPPLPHTQSPAQPPQGQSAGFQPPQAQRPVFEPPPAYSNSAPYQNPGPANFQHQPPYPTLAGQQQPLPIHRPGNEVPLPINRPGQQMAQPLHRPAQEASLPPNPGQQTNGSPFVAKPIQPLTVPENGGTTANHPSLQTHTNGVRPPFVNSQPLPNRPNAVQPFAQYPQQQHHTPYANGNRPYPQPPNGQPYVNPVSPQPYSAGQPYGTYPATANQQPYQTVFAPPQSYPSQTYPSPYAPGRPYMPPPFAAPKSSMGALAKIFIAVVVIGAVVGFTLLRALVNRERTESMGEDALTVKYLKVPNRDSASIEGMRENFINYLGKDRDARFGFEEMQRQLFSGIDEIVYDKEKGEVLFLVRECSEANPDKVQRIIDRYAMDPSKVFYGESFKQKAATFSGKTKLGWANHCPLVIPLDNIRINPYSSVEIKYATATYKLSAQELADFMTDKSIFSGPMRIFSKDRVQRELNVFGNHGAFVAKPNEPSLTRLAASLIAGGSSMSRETKIQQLLNFVSSEITYDDAEAKFKGEILKRPDETLLTRRGDCSSKTILMASLLEQIGEDYRLVYYIDHITVAVQQRGFGNRNNLAFPREGETWVIAETTVPGFVIGETSIENKSIFRNIQYIQRPGKANDVSAFDNLKEIFLQ